MQSCRSSTQAFASLFVTLLGLEGVSRSWPGEKARDADRLACFLAPAKSVVVDALQGFVNLVQQFTFPVTYA